MENKSFPVPGTDFSPTIEVIHEIKAAAFHDFDTEIPEDSWTVEQLDAIMETIQKAKNYILELDPEQGVLSYEQEETG